jgi:quinol monooxygenase YgiN
MSKHVLFLQHRTKPGARDAVQRVWQKHMQPAIEANAGHEIYVYAFGSDPDRICAFQVYASAEEASAFLKTPAYLAYEKEVAPLLEGPPDVEVLQPQWIKASH